jgi:tetratricopeptide (TPR) repeat protein
MPPTADGAVAESSFRPQWISEDEAIDAVLAFEQKHGARPTLLACHAVFPLFVSPELVNLIHINFLDDQGIPWIAEPDFLLSSLCRSVGDGLYRVVPRVREILLTYLFDKVDDGEDRLHRLADFLLAHLEGQPGPAPRPEVTRAWQWIAWSYLAPHKVVEDMTALLAGGAAATAGTAALLARHVEVATMAEVVRTPLACDLPESAYRDLFETVEFLANYWYASKEQAADVSGPPAAEASEAANPLLRTVTAALRKGTAERAAEPLAAGRPAVDADRLAELVRAVEQRQRVIIVCGPPNRGKTTLLLELARQLAARYPDGRVFYSMGPEAQRSTAGILADVLHLLEPNATLPTGRKELGELYRSVLQSRRTIVIVKNVNDPEPVDLLFPPPGSLLLVSTTKHFAVRGAYVLAGLELPPPPEPWADRPELDKLRGALLASPMPREARGRTTRAAGRPTEHGPRPVVVLLHGADSTGKMSLAAKAAWDEEVRRHFHDGILWAFVRSADDVMTHLVEMAAVLGGEASGLRGIDEGVARVRELLSGRRCLLIIDARENLQAALPLLDLPFLAILLVTQDTEESRKLAERADRVITVAPLSQAVSMDLLSRLVPAVTDPRLLARAAALTRGLPGAHWLLGSVLQQRALARGDLAGLIDRLEGEAEKAKVLSPKSYWTWTLLEAERDDAQAGQARREYSQLSVFAPHPADFGVPAAAYLWSVPGETAREWLQYFHGRRLLLAGAMPDRYALTPDRAEVGRAFLPPQNNARDKCCRFYLGLVNENQNDTGTIAREWLQIENAWRAFPDDAPDLFEFVTEMGPFFRQRGRWQEHVTWLERALAMAQRADWEDAASRLFVSLGGAFQAVKRLEEALRCYRSALSLIRRGLPRQDEPAILRAMADLLTRLNRPQEAQAAANEAARLLEEMAGEPPAASTAEGATGAPKGPSLAAADSHQVVEILTHVFQTSLPRGQPVTEFLRQIGLPESLFGRLGKLTDPTAAAQALVSAAVRDGVPVQGNARPGFTVLGALFAALIERNVVQRKDARFLAEVIVRTNLIDRDVAEVAPIVAGLLQAAEHSRPYLVPGAAPPPDRPRGACWRVIYDAQNREALQGQLVRREGDPPSGDSAVDEAYDALGTIHAFFWQVYGRDSIDDRGMPLVAVVHYGQKYTNAFWLEPQLALGDGDGLIFNRMSLAPDVVARQVVNGLVTYEVPYPYLGELGIILSSMADVFPCLARQYVLHQTAAEADWLFGAGLFVPTIRAQAVRSLAAPGTAYDDPQIGKDPQTAHMQNFVVTDQDLGGVHLNSGIPSHAFYRLATALGGYAWEEAGRIWYETLRSQKFEATTDFQAFARLTLNQAEALFSTGSRQAEAVVAAWEAVGLDASGQRRPRTARRRRPGHAK